MKQMNEMSARALSMEELENVNGGRVMFQGGYKIKEKIEKIKNRRETSGFFMHLTYALVGTGEIYSAAFALLKAAFILETFLEAAFL